MCVCVFIWVIITVTSRNERPLLPTCHEFPRMQCTDPSKQVKHDSITKPKRFHTRAVDCDFESKSIYTHSSKLAVVIWKTLNNASDEITGSAINQLKC